MKKIFLFILLMFNIINVNAYENKYFNIEIPEDYKITIEQDNLYKWENEDKYISITISNNINGYTVKNYTDEDIANQKKYIEDKINTNLDEYGTKVQVTDMEKILLDNGIYSLNYTIYWPTEEHTGYDIYQFGNVISTDKYMFTLVYNSNTKVDEAIFKNILNSFKPIDMSSNQEADSNEVVFLIILIALLILIFILLISKTKKEKKKKRTNSK